jgi:hypothetical protein
MKEPSVHSPGGVDIMMTSGRIKTIGKIDVMIAETELNIREIQFSIKIIGVKLMSCISRHLDNPALSKLFRENAPAMATL